MKKQMIIAVCLLLFASCSKSGGSGSTPSGTTLNSTETSLLGTWYLKKEFQSFTFGYDTTITGYNSSCYMQFSSDYYGGGLPSNNKKGQNAFSGAQPTASPISILVHWFYDPAVSKLNISGVQYDILVLTSTDLNIKVVFTGYTLTYYFTK